uniref:Uncharacterized protein n=1 Tax=Arundo donax TaxID=35708 RepID=A0A0A8YVF7_ARUDO
MAGVSVNVPFLILKPIAVPRLKRRRILLWNALMIIKSSKVVACCPFGKRSRCPGSTPFCRFPK